MAYHHPAFSLRLRNEARREKRALDEVVYVGTFDVKAVFKRIRFSRKVVLIGGGILLLGGASGVAAIVVGRDQLFGPDEVVQNGLECKTAQTVKIKKNGSVWIRKFVRTDGGDGPERMKTALRVAKAIYDKDHPDLVQVSVLDTKGPQMRADMRGRSIAAQAVYIADLSKLPEGAASQNYSAYYYDGAVADDGQFYGLRIDLPVEDAKAITASLTEFADCVDPVVAPAGDGHGAPAGGHGEPAGHGAEAGGHGDSKGSDGHGADAKASDGHGAEGDGHGGGEKPAEGGHDAPANAEGSGHGSAEPLLTSTPEGKSESMFSFGYIKSLLFGKGETTAVAAEQPAAEGHGEPAAAEGHGDAPVSENHGEAEGHSAPAVAEEPAAQDDAASGEAAGGHDAPVAQASAGHEAAAGGDHAAEAPKPEH
ncbi:hypothetical protein QE408_004282 [Agrobacterium larrymoorei]|uniref:Uncharacterized protein n=1 Tax=Agrobacterium larrymoorei TaxID=160699 RepID=A0ABU0UQ98_9HYPH|nr:hypothetical protein [Agrobacterium larrymoorei]